MMKLSNVFLIRCCCLLWVMVGVEGCVTETIQTCFRCDIPDTCEGDTYFANNATECQKHLDDTFVYSVRYQEYDKTCTVSTCNGLKYSSSADRVFRYTCNTECPIFYLSIKWLRTIPSTPTLSVQISSETCFDLCFDTVNCFMWNHALDTTTCYLHTDCGWNCSSAFHIVHVTYIRTCIQDCGELDNPANGEVSYIPQWAPTTEYSLAIFDCDTGYELSTYVDNMMCQSNGTWSDYNPTCSPIDCGNLSAPANGAVYSPGGTTYSSEATYICATGYNLSVDVIRTCDETGLWNNTEPTCDTIDCGTTNAPTGGTVDLSNGTTFGKKATYTCNPGTVMIDNGTRTCQSDGKWNGTAPVCLRDCGALGNLSNGSVDTSNGTMAGSTASYSCNYGYVIVGVVFRTCQDVGYWNGSEPLCNLTDCGTPGLLGNGAVDISGGTLYGATATYSCDPGYSLVGSSTRTCQATATWSGNEPTCDVIDCGIPSHFLNGTVDLSSGTIFGATVTYSCDSGYSLEGSSARTCLATATWSDSEPLCNIIDCGALVSPANGSVDTSVGTKYGDTASYWCNIGQTMMGDANRTCLADAVWSGGEPSCVDICNECGSSYNGSGSNTVYKPKNIYIVPCRCVKNKTFTGMTIDEIIAKMIFDTTINTKNTSLARNKLICKHDNRPSSSYIGYGGIAFLIVSLGTLVFIDLSKPYKTYWISV